MLNCWNDGGTFVEKKKNEWLSLLLTVVITVVVVLIVRQFLFAPVVVSGPSMEPTFDDGNRVFISKTSKPKHFDLVVFHAPNSKDDYIKRIIGLPGDVIEMENDELRINGEKFEEPYLEENKTKIPTENMLTENFKVEVPEGQYFVMGDNRRQSTDSRSIGPIHGDSIVGIVKFQFYPFSGIGIPK